MLPKGRMQSSDYNLNYTRTSTFGKRMCVGSNCLGMTENFDQNYPEAGFECGFRSISHSRLKMEPTARFTVCRKLPESLWRATRRSPCSLRYQNDSSARFWRFFQHLLSVFLAVHKFPSGTDLTSNDQPSQIRRALSMLSSWNTSSQANHGRVRSAAMLAFSSASAKQIV